MKITLSFDTLRAANLARFPEFKNAQGEQAHSQPDGSDWSLNDWCTAAAGELGEAANILKKIRRGDFTLEDAIEDLADELADAQIYLDCLANRAGIDLGAATVRKWNKTSRKIGCRLRLGGLSRPGFYSVTEPLEGERK